MSRTIDERVVSMQFDNKQFERNVSTTMSTLDKLKAKLKLSDASKGFDSLSKAAKKCDLNPLSRATETVGLKFNAMYTMADQAFRNITNSAYRAGVNITKSLTIDPVKTGLQEYETQIGAIQTILANTQSKGTTLDDVNAALGELNTYADKTIYNFTEMTRNIGTFTAAGVDLDKSVTAIKGIANLAAVSGSTSQQASTAMYQLSQALASGTVKLMDWNSVVNAGMGGQVFQDALKETARLHGVAIDQMIKDEGSFRETLKDGWLTSEILIDTLAKFTDESTELGRTATDAATKVKTFTQLLDTLKEAAQSGWTRTWELIIGDFDEAKELWTKVSDVIGGFINNMSESRNNLLEGALTSKWDRLLEKLNEAGVSSEEFEDKVRKTTKEHGQDLDALIKEYGSFEKAIRSGAVSADVLKKALKGVNQQGADLSLVKGLVKRGQKNDQVKQIEGALKALGYDLVGKEDGKNYSDDGYFGTLTEEAIKDFQKLQGLKVTGIVDEETLNALKKATTRTSELTESVFDLVDGVTELGGRELLLESFANLFRGLKTVMAPIAGAFKEIFSPITSEGIYSFLEGFRDLTAKMRLNAPQIVRLKNTFKGLFSVLDIIKDVIWAVAKVGFKLFGKATEGLGNGVLNVASSVGTAITKFRDWLKETDKITEVVEKGAKAIVEFVVGVKDWIKAFMETPEVQAKIEKIMDAFKPFTNIIAKIKEFATAFTKIGSVDELTGKVYGFGDAIKEFGTNLWEYVSNLDFKSIFGKIKTALGGFWTTVSKYLTGIGDKFTGVGEGIMGFIGSVKNFLSDNFGGILAFGFLFGIYKVASKIHDIVMMVKPLTVFIELMESLGKAFNSLSLYLKAKAVTNIATAIAILAGSLAVLSMLDQGKVWSAVGAIAVLLTGVIFIINSLGKIDKEKFAEFGKLSVALLGISAAILVMAIAAKTIGNMEGGDLIKAGVAIGAFLIIIKSMAKTTNGISGNLQGFGIMMLALSGSLLLLAQVAKTFGKMETGVLIKGALAVTYFLVLVQGMMKATTLLDKDLPKFGSVMFGIGAALLLMAQSVKILGGMDAGSLIKGVSAITALMGGIVGLMAATKLVTTETKDMARFGRLMSGVGIALIAMSVAVKILGSMDIGDIIKGEIALGAMLAMVAGMMKATQLLTKNSANAGKIGVMMLAFSGAMLLLTGSIAILAMIDGSDIAKATAAIAAVGGIFAGLIAVTKFVPKDCKATLITLSVAVGILAVAITALSFIDPSRLMGASAGLSMVIGMFALLTASTKFIGAKTIGTLVALTLIVGALAGIIYLLSGVPADGALKVAVGLSALILSLSASCVLLAGIGATGPAAFIGIGVLAALMVLIGGFAAIAIASLPTIGSQLSKFMENLDGFIKGAEKITPDMASGIKTLADALLVLTGTSLLNGIASFLGGNSIENFGKKLKTFGEGLADFSDSVSGESFDVEAITAAASAAEGLVKLNTALSGSTASDSFWGWLSGAMDIGNFGTKLETFGEGLASFSKSVSGDNIDSGAIKAAVTAAEGLVSLNDTLSKSTASDSLWGWLSGAMDIENFGGKLATFGYGLADFSYAVSSKTFDAKKVTSAAKAAEGLVALNTALSGSTASDSFWGWLKGATDIENFASKLATFGHGLVDFSYAVSSETFDASKVTAAAKAAEGLAAVNTALSGSTASDSFWGWLKGATDVENFGTKLGTFGEGLAAFSSAVSGNAFDAKAVTGAAKAAKGLAEVNAALAGTTSSNSLWGWISGASDISTFGDDLGAFGRGLASFSTEISGVKNLNDSNTSSIISAAKGLAEVGTALSGTTNAESLWGWISGAADLGTFATDIETFGKGLAAFSKTVSGDSFDATNAGSAIEAATKLGDLAKVITENTAGWDWLMGHENLSDFATNVEDLAGGLSAFSTAMTGDKYNASAVSTGIKEIGTLVGLSQTLTSNADYTALSTFGDAVYALGDDLAAFAVDIEGLNGANLQSLATGLILLSNINVNNADTLQEFITALGSISADGLNAFIKTFEDSKETLKSVGGGMVTNIISGIGDKVEDMSTAGTVLAKKAISGLNALEVHRAVIAAGDYFVRGFASGISINTFKATAMAKAMANAALRAAENTLDINSPSKETQKLGGFFGQGFVNALADYESIAYNASARVAESAKSGLSNAISKVQSIIDGGMDGQPTIRPVLDLSEVQAGAGAIGGMFGMHPSIGLAARVGSINASMNSRQNGGNGDIISAIKDLGDKMGTSTGDTYNVGDVTYDDGSNVANTVRSLTRAVRVERRR